MKYFALVDCDSFFCSCERVFRPETRGRPIIVLSNNDGCAVSFSREAKAIGLGIMCDPYYKLKDTIRKHNIAVFSSNYTLYDDMSKRVMSVAKTHAPRMEVYSIDEAFLEFDGMEDMDLFKYAANIRKDILQKTGIPTGVGVAPTKVLAKVATKVAKKSGGTFFLATHQEADPILKTMKTEDLWGIGKQSSLKLKMLGIRTAYEFKYYENQKSIQKLLSINAIQIQDELRGISCLHMEDAESQKSIMNTRSFGIPIRKKEDLQEALSTFATHATEKLRSQGGVCFGISAYIRTSYFKEGEQYVGQDSYVFQSGTADTFKVIKAASEILDRIYKTGFDYKSAGVILNHIVTKNESQLDLFNQDVTDKENLNTVIDQINQRYGSHTIQSAACGINQNWKLIADHKSKRVTTSWRELMEVKIA